LAQYDVQWNGGRSDPNQYTKDHLTSCYGQLFGDPENDLTDTKQVPVKVLFSEDAGGYSDCSG
jgi:hypothetical protein